MEIMTKNFKTHGGQMRQFIVDDKGTCDFVGILNLCTLFCAFSK